MPDSLFVNTSAGRVRVVVEKPQKAASLYYRFHLDGKRHYASTKTNDIRAARKAARAAVEQAVSSAGKDDLPLGMLIDKFLEMRGATIRPKTLAGYEQRLALFRKGRDVISVAHLSFRQAVELCQAHLDSRRTLSPVTVKNDRLALSAFFGWTNKRHALWPNNPASADFLDLPHSLPQTPETIPQAALRAFLEASRESPIRPVVALCMSGMRPRPATELHWSQIDFDSASITFSSKVGRRTVPLGAWALAELQACRQDAGQVWPFHPDSAHDEVRKVRKGISDKITLNRLRAEGERMLWQAGTSPAIAARIMGHSVKTAQRHYVDLQAIHAHAAAAAISPDSDARPSEKPSESSSAENVSRCS